MAARLNALGLRLRTADTTRAAFEIRAVEGCAAAAAAAQIGEFEEIGFDACESLVGKSSEAGDHALYADACLRRADGTSGNAPTRLVGTHQAAKSAVAITAPGVPS
jgi:hypothetical protein